MAAKNKCDGEEDIDSCTEAGERLKADTFVEVKIVVIHETEAIPFEDTDLDVKFDKIVDSG